MQKAVIDLGTNTFKLLIVELGKNKFHILHKSLIGVKLIKKEGNNGFTKAAIKRGVDALEKFQKTILAFEVEETYAFATSAFRNTKDSKKIIDAIYKRFGIFVRIITGKKEAYYTYKGVKQAVSLSKGYTLITDIGGGSIELIICNKKGLQWTQSIDIGMARILNIFSPSNPIQPKEVEKIEAHFLHHLEEFIKMTSIYPISNFIGCSGAFETLSSLVLAKKGSIMDFSGSNTTLLIHRREFEDIYKNLLYSTIEERTQMPGMEIIRVEMIVLASIFINFMLKLTGTNNILYSSYSLREGAISEVMNL